MTQFLTARLFKQSYIFVRGKEQLGYFQPQHALRYANVYRLSTLHNDLNPRILSKNTEAVFKVAPPVWGNRSFVESQCLVGTVLGVATFSHNTH